MNGVFLVMNPYIKVNWRNDRSPYLDENNLNHMDEGIYQNSLNINNKVDIPSTLGVPGNFMVFGDDGKSIVDSGQGQISLRVHYIDGGSASSTDG